ncbi:MAG TPA: 2-hydroxyglutaryl-CoA dehydratase [Syntrophaceae bacterium]|jgi:predicted CoA-substrate-specific enzyme activase|nr:2-hydroxyglutaryl-CoA dehydratase [Syntrophaceae bacterium]
MHTAGIDIGSITTKGAIMKDMVLLGTKVIFTGYNAEIAGKNVLETILAELDIDHKSIDRIVSTGYGRKALTIADKAITEITCHAAGAHYINHEIRSIIDVGGQDSKAIIVDEKGNVVNFAMNDKCAAGTGRFLEVMAGALEVNLDAFSKISLKADNPAKISSLCTVFAESEVISLISKGEKRENIIAGIHESLSVRISAMMKRIGIKPPIMMTGGVAKNIGLVKALEKQLNVPIEVSVYAQENGAIGAALLAQKARP